MRINSPTTMAFPGPPRRAGGLLRYLVFAVIMVSLLFYLRHSSLSAAFNSVHKPIKITPTHLPSVPTPQNPFSPDYQAPALPNEPTAQKPVAIPKPGSHPIDTLIEKAEKTLQELLKKESHDIKTAAAEYRKRRGRHPPPGFDVWFKFAQDNNAVMVEDFFDQIYHDLGPFWGLKPSQMRKEARSYEMDINIRDNKATTESTWFWTEIWLDLITTIEHMLPDMDIALNPMDEPRILLPWEDINKYMDEERATRVMSPPEKVITEYQTLASNPEPTAQVQEKNWEDEKPYWKIAVRGCPPDSLARKAEVLTDHSQTPSISLAHTAAHTYRGYVSNYTLSTDFCHQPDLQSVHGMMIEPLSISSTRTLFPMFGGSKLPTNNEILLPAPMYWSNEERFSGGSEHGKPWAEKDNKVIWRGVATGGRNMADNWKGFQRHRFVAQTNGTKISDAESWTHLPENWAMPSSQYGLAAQQESCLGEWTKSWADTGFVDMNCCPIEANATCEYTSPYFKLLKGMTMAEQFDRKFLPDIDGNSFSGRYRGFLMSTSLPIKATIFREWHDSRLIAWKHFVPMDNRFMDFWGIMEYFLGYEGKNIKVEGHDKEAEKIAMDGQEWANQVLRKEDMQIYVMRVLLEYARVTDDERHKMGWVGDLL